MGPNTKGFDVRYLSMILLSTAALGTGPMSGQFSGDPNAYGPARWVHGQLSTGGPAGWFLARDTPAGPVVYSVDQPSGRKEPSYTHYRGPAAVPSRLTIDRAFTGEDAANGVQVGQMTGLAGHGPLLVTDGSPSSDVEARKVMEEVAGPAAEGPRCPPNRPCPNNPEPGPDEPDDEPDAPPLDQYRKYAVPAALFVAGCLLAYRMRQIRKGF